MKKSHLMLGAILLVAGMLLAGCDSCGCGGRSKNSGLMITPGEYSDIEKAPVNKGSEE